MTTVKETKTEKNLLSAYAGECRDHATYLYFAKVAKKEGYIRASRIFEETAQHELSHAKNFLKRLSQISEAHSVPFGGLGLNNTIGNLHSAIESEGHESETLYLEYATVAKEEGFQDIAVLFQAIAKAEGFHKRRFEILLQEIENNTAFQRDKKVTWVCTKCGYIYEGETALQKCPACGHPQGYFEVLADW